MQIEHRTGAADGAAAPRSIETSCAVGIGTLDMMSYAGCGGIDDHAVVLVEVGREKLALSDCAYSAPDAGDGNENEFADVGEDDAGLDDDVGLDVATKTVAYSCPCSGDMGRHSCIQSRRFWWLRNKNRAERARPTLSIFLD